MPEIDVSLFYTLPLRAGLPSALFEGKVVGLGA